MVLRFILLIGVLILIFILSVNASLVTNLSQKIPGVNGLLGDPRIKGLTSRLPPQINDPKGILKTLQDLATPSAQKFMQPILNDLQQNVSQLPEQAMNNLPRLIEIITNAKKEELYLVSPKSLIVPQITDGQNGQQITLQLDTFEIRDTRKSNRPWNLIVYAKGDSSLTGNITFDLKKENIKVVDGSIDGITIEEGTNLKISSQPGKGKGTFRFNPLIIINLPKDFATQETRIEIDSSFE